MHCKLPSEKSNSAPDYGIEITLMLLKRWKAASSTRSNSAGLRGLGTRFGLDTAMNYLGTPYKHRSSIEEHIASQKTFHLSIFKRPLVKDSPSHSKLLRFHVTFTRGRKSGKRYRGISTMT